MKLLSELKKNQSTTLKKINADIHLKRRLFEFGLLPNESVKILFVSPLKNTYLIGVKGYTLALRKTILDCIEVIDE